MDTPQFQMGGFLLHADCEKTGHKLSPQKALTSGRSRQGLCNFTTVLSPWLFLVSQASRQQIFNSVLTGH